MTYSTQTSRRRLGVTLVEMMVALAITTFVILVINKLFNEVIQTVGRGTQAGEILQRSRAFDEQIANETELIISGGRKPATEPYDWFGRMVGPAGRESGQPGGFLVIVQRVIPAPLTLDDQLKGITRNIRSDQLMFIYDQKPLLDASGKKRLPPLAPSGDGTYSGDMRNSVNADYVKLWYGHVLQIRDGDQAANYPVGNISQIDLGVLNGTNPNAIAQDWVLGRHALFLMKDGIDPITSFPYTPVGIHANGVTPFAGITGPGGSGQLWNGMADVSTTKLSDFTGSPTAVLGNPVGSAIAYQAQILAAGNAIFPLLTSAKPSTTLMISKDIAPSHTYFMGGVSDFIVEWAGDVVDGVHYTSTSADIDTDGDGILGDGELDRDPEGRIKWYTHRAFNNRDLGGGNLNAVNPNMPVTYPSPLPVDYPPYSNIARPRAQAAFVWQHDGSPGFTQWPWMIRIRYRLHDRRGEFNGREITVNAATGETEPEAGAWFEMVIPVNYQGVK